MKEGRAKGLSLVGWRKLQAVTSRVEFGIEPGECSPVVRAFPYRVGVELT